MSIKSANVIARVNPDIKKQAEEIIYNLGLNASSVINALYRQIIINKKIPFEICEEPINVDDLSEEELGKLLVQRIKSFEKEGGIPFEQLKEELHNEFINDRRSSNK